MKRGLNKFFSILLVLCMLLSMIPMAALAATPTTLYLKPNSNWVSDGARFAAYFFGNGESWASMTDSDGDGIYECAVPSGYTSVIFCRMNGSNSTNNWSNKWNQTSDLGIPTDGTNCYTIAAGAWDNGGGSWSTVSTEPVQVDYYLFGYINGANYGCEEDAANMGSYKFSSGKLTATFTAESYVGVKTSNNANWYMTEGFQGTSKSVTLINTNNSIVNPDKLYVPAGIKVTFTLTENADGTLTLKYSTTKSTCQHLFYTDGVCNACGQGEPSCSHSYSSKVTTAATCTAAGVKTYTCSLCGHSYAEPIAATGHSYSGGKCSVCGEVDPSTVPSTYYLVGYINGANYGCEEDYLNMGSYKFSDGKLTATFTVDSYVFVKTEGNGAWYMAESYCEDTTCKFTVDGSEKMYVPGGVEVTFTLTENSDGSITLKYTKSTSSCQHLTHTTAGKCTVCGASVSHTWASGVCSGCGMSCSHASHNQSGICSTCGVSVSHSYSGNTCTVCGKTTSSSSSLKVHFVDSVVWQNVTAHIWKQKGTSTTTLNSWPGEILNRDANGYFTMNLDYKPVSGESLGFIFTNFNGGQTADTIVDYSTLSSGEIWIKPNNWTNGDGKYDCYVTTVESSMYVSPEINGTSVTFRYENSAASKVYVAGSFNGWSTTANKLTKGSDGFWTTTVSMSEGVYEYKFIVDGEWILDPRNGLIGGYDNNSLVITGNAGSTTASNVTVKLHFYRESGDYANWDAWMWSSTNEGQGCTFVDDPVYKGKTATFTIPGGSNAWVNYKIRKTDWSDEEFYTRSIDISNIQSGTVHFFLNSGSAEGSTVYGNDVIKMGKPTYANLDYNSGNIWVKTPLPVSGDFTKAFSVVKSDGSASGISVTGVTMDNNGYSLILSRKPALIEVHDLVVKCGTTVGIETDGLFYSSGFANDYTYYGNDLGATWSKSSTTFKVWAPTATGVSVMLFRGGNHGGDDWISTTEMKLGEKGVYTVTINGDLDGVYYNYLVSFPGYTTEATDPYAKTTGANGDRGMIINMDAYDPEGWDKDLSPNQGMNYTDAIIYEMHIREMTIDSTSGVKEEWRGKYLGLTQEGTNYEGRATALDHIKELGVTHVQLMPTYDHAGVDEYHLTDWQQYAWGYNPKNFNVPEGSFSTDPYNGEVRVTEMKQMVQAFHSKGINVVMDVVYNHTFSGGDFCYNKIVPNYFSRFWSENNWSNGSGVGNDFATERSMGRNYIVDSIFYWVEEYHIDGFRFDLAGLIDIQTMNEVISTVQARYPYVIFYGEGWTVGGTAIQDGHWTATKENAWQTGSLAFYNDTFRNDIAGDNGNSWGFATGDSGKADAIGNYFRASNGWSSSPSQTINYVSCHDNYTLIDKIIISRNGAYWDQMVKMNNMSAAIYMLAQGIPYIYSGEELLREKKDEWGNRYHNTYDSSDYITKIRWNDLVDKEYAQVTDDYYAGLVNFRKNHAALRNTNGSDAWGYTQYYKINDHCIMFYVSGYPNYECSDGIVIIYNANEGTQWVNIYDYGVPYGNWQACVHGMTAGVNPLWSTYDGGVGVEGLSTTVLVLGDLVHEESVYNNQSYSCSHSYHNQSGLCWDCGAKVDHYFVNGYCNHCNLAQSASGSMTIYFDNSASQWGNVYAYAWTETGGRTTTYTESWPGDQMTSVGNNVFAVTVPCAANNIIFTDNYGNQTVTQGLIKNDNGVLTSNLYYSDSASWGNYTAACSHSSHNSNGVCSNCGINVGHNWNNGYCSGCKTTCSHSSHNVSGYCTNCSSTVSHSWSYGKCTVCNKTCAHSWSNGKCSNCGMACAHSYHDQNGYCYTCGSSVSHSYYGGLCSACGAYKQGYIESQSYYLAGYINDANYGCEDDYQNLGSYKFSNGKLTTTFATDSYVYVKTGDNASHYMTNGYQDGVTSVTLYDSRTVSGDKLYVPGGTEVTFTLTVNSSNNTMVLSYEEVAGGCSHSYTSKVTTAATCTTTGVKTFTCSKCANSYTQTIPATGHSYLNGSCTACGAADPNGSATSTNYYLVGYINGADYGCEGDWENMGNYKFSGGKLSARFDEDSYIFIKTENNGKWLLADAYTEETSCTFKEGGSEKMFVPGGVQLTFTLTENADGSVTVSYTEGSTTACTHNYTYLVTKSPTCTTTGVKTYTCTKCGNSYIESIPTISHNYVSGTCTYCGGFDGSTSMSSTYYLVGWINDADYGCESDWENNGDYKFVNGQLSVKFDSDSYVFVKTENNGKWLLADYYCTDTTCTFKEGSTEKMFVPGGVQLIFSIVENADGSVTVSYTEGSTSSCTHSYTASVTTAATCTTTGIRTYTCSKCGDSYTQSIPATGHNFFGGSCSVCGAADPNAGSDPVSGTTYYLVGYINGADYGCEGDYQNMGQYKFVNGRLTATFTQDSYVFLKTENNGKWLLAPSYTEASTCTFGEGAGEKMFVPGGVQLTFMLTENDNETVTLTYTTGSVPASTIPTLTLKSPTLEFRDMITVNAFYTAENTADVVEMGMITYSSQVSRLSIRTAEHVIPGATYVESSGRYYSSSQGIYAKYLADTVYLAIYAKLADGSYAYSKLAPYSPLTYANSQLKNSTNTALKQLVVAMLNYGAEAQLYFGHNTGNLANAALTAEYLALPESYRSDMVSSVPSASASKQGIFANNQGFASRKPAISFEGAFCINYFFTPNYAPASGITMYYWNEADYNANNVLTTSNATGSFKLSGNGTGEYRGDITGIAAKNISEAVYVACAYKDSNGTVWTSGVLGYSIGAYCSSQASKGGDIADLAKATAVYGYHAKAYFG